MMKNSAIAIHILFILSGTLFAESRTVRMNLNGQRIQYTLRYDSSQKAWADDIERRTETYLQILTEYFGGSFPQQNGFVIEGRREVTHEGRWVGGYNTWNEVALQYDLTPVGRPGLLYHELGHFWLGRDNMSWIDEGAISILPLALDDMGMLDLSEEERESVMVHWNLRGPMQEWDRPVRTDFRKENPDQFGFYYVKTARIQYLVYRLLGAESYRSFLQDYAPVAADITEEELIRMLNGYRREDWRSILSGWVFPGGYGAYPPGVFLDDDSDGLLTLDETVLGTDPRVADTDGDRLPDGFEISRGLDPLRKASNREAVIQILESGPFTDGNGEEWSELPFYEASDSRGEIQAGYDITGIRLAVRGEYLYVLMMTAEPPERRAGVIMDVQADTDGDRRADAEYAFYLDNPRQTWIYYSASETSRNSSGMTGGVNNGMEIRIPLEDLPAGEISLMPIIYDTSAGLLLDQLNSGITFSKSLFAGVEDYGLQTGPGIDTDGDFIPDLVELTAGLDPSRTDRRETVTQLGPFPDGSGSEWNLIDSEILDDPAGDSVDGDFDLIHFEAFVKDDILYVMAETSGTLAAHPDVFFDLLVDNDGDGYSNGDIAFMLNNPAWPWVYVHSSQQTLRPAGLSAHKGAVLEMTIPMSLFTSHSIRIMPILYDNENKRVLDQTDSWITVK